MFNPLNNPFVVRTVLDKAQEELNEQLRYRKKQFNNPKLYMWVEIDPLKSIPYVCLRNENDENIVRMTAEELLQDEAVKQQLKKIPMMVRPFINFKWLISEINKRLVKDLALTKFIKITEGQKTAELEIWEKDKPLQVNIDLFQIFG